MEIGRIVAPRSVAVIGASEDTGKFGGRVLHYLVKHGFPGTLLPINPNRATLRGLVAYPNIGAAPGPIDVAILAVPVGSLLRQIEDCAAAGVGACIVITNKLADAGPEGLALQDKVVATARAAGMRLVGPNCLGIFNMTDHTQLSSSLVLDVETLEAGGIGIVSQSGALMGTLVSSGIAAGAAFSRGISVGNQADLELADFFEFLIEDAATKVITLYVEALKDAPRFFALARRARAAGKPVLAVKAGRTEAGVRTARSHTASLAGDYASFAACCAAHGVVLMEDPGQMVLAADALIRMPRLPRAGLGVGIVSGSGGGAAVAGDAAMALGLRLPELSAATRAALGEWLEPAQCDVPLDFGAFRDGSSAASVAAALSVLLADAEVGALVFPMTTQPRMAATAAEMPAVAARANKPLLFVMSAGEAGDAARAALRQAGYPCFDRVGDALAVLKAMDAVAAWVEPEAPVRPAVGPLPALRPGLLTEPEAKALVASYGLPVVREAVVASAEEAVRMAARIGYPVVLKGVSRSIVHKSDAGLVRLALADAEAVQAAYAAVRALPGVDGCVVAQMVKAEAEVILGTRYDATYGPMLLAGFGGVLVEVLKDVQLAPCPVTPATAEAMLRRLALWPMLAGVRGRPPLAVPLLVEAMVRLSWLAADLGPRLQELDINPLMLGTSGAVAVDARAVVA